MISPRALSLPAQRARGTRDATGVTLLELLVAVAILGVIAGVLYGTFSRTLVARDRASVALERYASGRAALDWLDRDLQGSFAPYWYPSGVRKFFAGADADGPTLERAPLLDITTTSARATTPLTGPLVALEDATRGDRGDQVRVVYHLEKPEREGSVGLDLVRYEHRPPLHPELEDASRAVIAHGIASITLRFFDGAAWHEEWDSSSSGSGQPGVAPRVVEARIRIAGDEGEPVELVSAVYLTLGGRHRG